MKDTDLYWLAGLLEDEGSFLAPTPSSPRRPIISLEMTDEDIVALVASLFGHAYHKTGEARRKGNGWKMSYVVRYRGHPAVLLMLRLRPLMGLRRQLQIDRALIA
jgi:hypothetical protein